MDNYEPPKCNHKLHQRVKILNLEKVAEERLEAEEIQEFCFCIIFQLQQIWTRAQKSIVQNRWHTTKIRMRFTVRDMIEATVLKNTFKFAELLQTVPAYTIHVGQVENILGYIFLKELSKDSSKNVDKTFDFRRIFATSSRNKLNFLKTLFGRNCF